MIESKIIDNNLPILRKDLIFKSFFKNKVNRLIFLINEITNNNFTEDEIEFIDTELPISNIFNKNARLDLFMKTKKGERINIELQNVVTERFDVRRVYYSALAFTQQMKAGVEYENKKVISIYIVYDTKDKFPKSLINFHKYDMIALEQEKSGQFIKDNVLIDEFIINLAKLDTDDRIKGSIHDFLSLFNIKNIKELDKMCSEKKFDDVYKEVKKLTQDEIAAYRDMIREVEETEYYGNLAELKKKSIAEGKEEGIKEGIKENNKLVIINSFKNNIDINTISTITNTSINEVNKLLKENNLI